MVKWWHLEIVLLAIVAAWVGKQNADKLARMSVGNEVTAEREATAPARANIKVPGEDNPENQVTDVPSNSNAEYIGVWMGDIGGVIQVQFKFNEDYSCEILIMGQDQIKTTYKILPDGRFQMLYNQGETKMEGSISYGKRGTYLDFCHYYGLKSKPGEVEIFGNSARGKECGSAVMR